MLVRFQSGVPRTAPSPSGLRHEALNLASSQVRILEGLPLLRKKEVMLMKAKMFLIIVFLIMGLLAMNELQAKNTVLSQVQSAETLKQYEGKIVDVYTRNLGVFPNMTLIRVETNFIVLRSRVSPSKEYMIPMEQVKAIMNQKGI
jgi:hypothetical protein